MFCRPKQRDTPISVWLNGPLSEWKGVTEGLLVVVSWQWRIKFSRRLHNLFIAEEPPATRILFSSVVRLCISIRPILFFIVIANFQHFHRGYCPRMIARLSVIGSTASTTVKVLSLTWCHRPPSTTEVNAVNGRKEKFPKMIAKQIILFDYGGRFGEIDEISLWLIDYGPILKRKRQQRGAGTD